MMCRSISWRPKKVMVNVTASEAKLLSMTMNVDELFCYQCLTDGSFLYSIFLLLSLVPCIYLVSNNKK